MQMPQMQMPQMQMPQFNIDETKERMTEFIGTAKTRITNPVTQKRFILIIVCIALLLDNMLYMVIVPIIPDFLRSIGAWDTVTPTPIPGTNTSLYSNITNSSQDDVDVEYKNENVAIGILFASKAIIQLFVNPFSGTLIDKIGYDIPMMIGLVVMFIATTVFAFGKSYGVLFFARSLQGVGSAFADTAGLAMIADRFTSEHERSRALGIALAFISFGCLVAPPFGGVLYEFAGKVVPFVILAFISLSDGFMLLFVVKPYSERRWQMPRGTPIYKLIIDPYIAVAAGALSMSNVALAFLEPTMALWMEDTMQAVSWQTGIIWLPAFFPHVIGVIITVKLAARAPHYQWLMAAIGMAIIGLSTFIVPFCKTFGVLIVPLCGICFGIALVDTALLPILGYLVDVRHNPVYGSIYAIADISYSLAYAIGPILAGQIVQGVGFLNLNIIIGVFTLAYVPLLIFLRRVYDMTPQSHEDTILLTEEPATGLYQSVKDEYKRSQKDGINSSYKQYDAFGMDKLGNGRLDGPTNVEKSDSSDNMNGFAGSRTDNKAKSKNPYVHKVVARQLDYSSLSEQED
ncbi:probable vesicular acetylcholine transporter-B [Lytechinus variegatus]|uniref:probable vesicular acetylcholine transporter-B n=1 Tax=Lytechinus variegatus TaxID=7654 RepID=UPI001BB16C21|nr:probable vesicular acetylcholine transporter-B [Lytechinus variegatus]